MMRVVPENNNPNAVRPLAFDFSILRRKYLRNYTDIDHDGREELEWPFVLAMEPDNTVLVEGRDLQ